MIPFYLNSTTYRYTANFGFTKVNLKHCIETLNAKMLQYHLSTPLLREPIKPQDKKEKNGYEKLCMNKINDSESVQLLI